MMSAKVLGLFTPHTPLSVLKPRNLWSYLSLQTYSVRRLNEDGLREEGTEMSNFRIEEQFIFQSVFSTNCVPPSECH